MSEMTWRTLNVVSLVAIALFVLLDASDLAQYLLQPGNYRFGTEVAGFRYTSSLHFVGSIVATFLIAAIAIAAPRLLRQRWASTGVRLTIAAMWTFTSLYFTK
jgi:hypothetical protein